MWRTRKVSRRGLSVWAFGAHGAPGMLPGWSSRDTWRIRRVPGVILPVGALGTRGVSGECPGYLPTGVTWDTWCWIPNGGLGFDRGLQTEANRLGGSGRRIYDLRQGSVKGFFFAERQAAGRGKAARRHFAGRL